MNAQLRSEFAPPDIRDGLVGGKRADRRTGRLSMLPHKLWVEGNTMMKQQGGRPPWQRRRRL